MNAALLERYGDRIAGVLTCLPPDGDHGHGARPVLCSGDNELPKCRTKRMKERP
jgi:hypothetical protein